MTLRQSWFACAFLLAGCSAGTTRVAHVFSTDWQDDGGRSIASVEAGLRGRPIPRAASVAVGVVSDGLIAVTLDGGTRWKFVHEVNARPWIAGGVVVGTGGGEVFALDARSGRKLWSRPATGRIRGAADDGSTTLVSLEPSGQTGGGLLAIKRDGTVTRQLETDVAIGRPALVNNVAFIPWSNQYVTAYDLGSGEEVARVTLRAQTSHAFVAAGSLYFGEIGATRFDDKIGGASRGQANHVALPVRELPGKPRWMRPGGFVLDVKADAFDRIAAYALPSFANGRLGLDSDRYYATYYRIVVGLSGAAGELVWTRTVDHDVIGGDAFQGGVAVCSSSGRVRMLHAASGSDAGSVDLGHDVMSCVVQADDYKVETGPGVGEPLVDQLSIAVLAKDAELVTMQRFLLRELVGQESEVATRTLIELASNPAASPVLVDDARAGLAARRNGAEFMIEALKKRYDYMHDVLTTPPVGPLADALAAMKERRAAPLLAMHLNEPADSPDDIRRAARALVDLASDEEAGALQTFFALYRAAADSPDLVAAVVDVARALMRVGGTEGRKLIEDASVDPLTLPEVRQALVALTKGGPLQPPAPAAR